MKRSEMQVYWTWQVRSKALNGDFDVDTFFQDFLHTGNRSVDNAVGFLPQLLC